jgi:DNA-directed RNA polymerase subunit RPC12/RpoP
MTEVLCRKCGQPLGEDDRGRYYAHVCKDCCNKDGLCPDCGGPVIITQKQAEGGFACSGWHTTEGWVFQPMGTQGKWGIPSLKEVGCPKCGHKFRV